MFGVYVLALCSLPACAHTIVPEYSDRIAQYKAIAALTQVWEEHETPLTAEDLEYLYTIKVYTLDRQTLTQRCSPPPVVGCTYHWAAEIYVLDPPDPWLLIHEYAHALQYHIYWETDYDHTSTVFTVVVPQAVALYEDMYGDE